MPITVIAPQGVLTPAGEREILPRLTAAVVEANGAPGNPFLTSIVGGSVHLLPPGDIYGGGANRPLVMVELKAPNIALGSLEARAAWIRKATDIVDDLTVDGHDRADTWVNVLNAPDGAWGLGGQAFTGEALLAAAAATR